eukprot:7501364-Karenia_brevis.AAC.1
MVEGEESGPGSESSRSIGVRSHDEVSVIARRKRMGCQTIDSVRIVKRMTHIEMIAHQVHHPHQRQDALLGHPETSREKL